MKWSRGLEINRRYVDTKNSEIVSTRYKDLARDKMDTLTEVN